jgi:hypothetical protein
MRWGMIAVFALACTPALAASQGKPVFCDQVWASKTNASYCYIKAVPDDSGQGLALSVTKERGLAIVEGRHEVADATTGETKVFLTDRAGAYKPLATRSLLNNGHFVEFYYDEATARPRIYYLHRDPDDLHIFLRPVPHGKYTLVNGKTFRVTQEGLEFPGYPDATLPDYLFPALEIPEMNRI